MKGDSADRQNYPWKNAENVGVIIPVYLKVWHPANMFDTNTLSDDLHMCSDIVCAILNMKADPRGAWGAYNLRFETYFTLNKENWWRWMKLCDRCHLNQHTNAH